MDTKDRWATALVAAAVVPYLGFLALGSVPFIEDVRGMAAVGLVLGFASRRVGGRQGFEQEPAAFVGGLGSTLLGIVALVTESDLVLALFMASMVGLWAAAVIVRRHTGHHGVGAAA